MTSTTGSEITQTLQAHLDRLWVTCVSCSLSSRQQIWDTGLGTSGPFAGIRTIELEDAIQDAGFRLGVLTLNAKWARFYGAKMG